MTTYKNKSPANVSRPNDIVAGLTFWFIYWIPLSRFTENAEKYLNQDKGIEHRFTRIEQIYTD